MDKYNFYQFSSSSLQKDPVFNSNDFTLYGDPRKLEDSHLLFEVYKINDNTIRYCLIEPNKFISDKHLLLKIRRYLLIHEANKKPEQVITYFIGDYNKSIDVSSEFINQEVSLVTIDMIEQWYPKSVDDCYKIIIDYVFKKQKYLGEPHILSSYGGDVLFIEPSLNDSEKRDYKTFILNSMEKEGLISVIRGSMYLDCFVLTAKAISLVSGKNLQQNKTAFIAIKFDGNEERINAIQNAIAQAGYEPKIMNQVETNNWIMPEIFYQIKHSRFVVSDFSLPCDGVYYESGYATALDIPVIHLFDNRELSDTNKLHFDIAQKSTIFYDDFNDLNERLVKRIISTIK